MRCLIGSEVGAGGGVAAETPEILMALLTLEQRSQVKASVALLLERGRRGTLQMRIGLAQARAVVCSAHALHMRRAHRLFGKLGGEVPLSVRGEHAPLLLPRGDADRSTSADLKRLRLLNRCLDAAVAAHGAAEPLKAAGQACAVACILEKTLARAYRSAARARTAEQLERRLTRCRIATLQQMGAALASDSMLAEGAARIHEALAA